MSLSVQIMCQACDELGIPYELLDSNQALLRISFKSRSHLIVNTTLGLNDSAQARLMVDKQYSYTAFSPKIKMPRTESFIDPDPLGRYPQFARQKSTQEISEIMSQHFSFPLIVKRNSGTQGQNVFLCPKSSDVVKSLDAIFSKKQVEYDHVALAQEYIKPVKEYRAIMFLGKVELVYLKDISKASYQGNLSPLHWDKSAAKMINDPVIIHEIQMIADNLMKVVPIKYFGLDIIQDEQGILWTIELNGSPGYGEFVKYCDSKPLISLYKKIVLYLQDIYSK